MAHTQDAILYDQNGFICMIVIPDDDAQLDDPAYNPPQWTHLRVPLLLASADQAQPAQAMGVMSLQAAVSTDPVDGLTAAIAAAAAQGITLSLPQPDPLADALPSMLFEPPIS